jgi:hypothetical protein
MKYILIYIALLFPLTTIAHGGHWNEGTTTTTTNTTNVVEESSGQAAALALAQCQFDYSHFLQGCISVGFHRGVQAGAVGLGKRLGEDMLINGGIAFEEGGELAGGAALNFKFK